MQSRRRRERRRIGAFSLIEIMIVVIIIGMIMALVGPNVMKNLKEAQGSTARNQIMLLANAIDDYYLDMAEYPAKLEDLVTNPGNDKWDGPYLRFGKIPVDPWGEPYGYRSPGEKGEYDIYSYGADKAPGGEGEAADLSNWE